MGGSPNFVSIKQIVMETILTKQLLEKLENRVDSHLQTVIQQFQNLKEEDLLRPSSTGGWSIAQCLAHLNSYGDYYLPEIGVGLAKIPSSPPSDTFKSSWLGAYFIKMMEPQTGKKKYKAFKGHIPSPTLDAYAVIAEFIQQQETLLSYLRRAYSADLNQIKIPISIARFLKLKLGDVFQFMIAHDERHLQQALRNLRKHSVLI